MKSLYDTIGKGYSLGRRTDPRVAASIHIHLEGAASIVNIGAGAGSYEPEAVQLTAVEPSIEMIRQRPEGAHPVRQASAESLPFEDNAFTHAMTVLSIHHWRDQVAAFDEIKRVITRRFVAVTWNPDAERFWLTEDYFPEIHDMDQAIFPTMEALGGVFEGIRFYPLPVPANCIDGFLGAYWSRPRAYLDPTVRQTMSSFSKIHDVERRIQRLRDDLDSGRWDSKYGDLQDRESLDLGYVVGVWDV